jgi:hypothetical protein
MASHAPLIQGFEFLLRDLVADLGVRANGLPAVLRKIEAARRSGVHVHPTWNLRVVRDGQPLYLRVLIRDDAELHRQRRFSVDLLSQIREIRRSRPAFVVPEVLDSGTRSRMFWDLETLVAGSHLPWSWKYPSQLTPYLQHAPRYVNAFDAFASMDLRLPEETWAKQRKSAAWFTNWAKQQEDFRSLPLDEVTDLQGSFFRARLERLVPTHPDLTHRNILNRGDGAPALLDWDGTHLGAEGEMFGRHWILMCSEPRWQEEVITALGRRSPQFWQAFHVYAWFRAIDQIHHELVTFQGRNFDSFSALAEVDPLRAHHVDQMLKAMTVLGRDVGRRPPARGETGRRHR